MKAAVFGGSFAPVHIGHMEVVRAVLDRGLAERVLLMPCRQNPLKRGNPPVAHEERLALLRKAVEYYRGLPREGRPYDVTVDETELSMPSPSYTCDTLSRLAEEHPDTEFRLVVGADSYLDFDRWKNSDWIVANFSPIVYPRPGYKIGPPRPGWTLLEGAELHDVSSTLIRDILRNGCGATEFMPWLRNETQAT